MRKDGVILHSEVMLTWVIPVYNGEKYIKQAIESILRQPCKDFEIIVVDDGSKDATAEIVKSYLNRGIRLIHKENGGVSSARNLGIREARGKYLAFLDADDIICKDAYSDTIHNLLLEGTYDLLSLSWVQSDHSLRIGTVNSVSDGEVNGERAKLDPYKPFVSFLYRRKMFEDNSSLLFPEGIRYAEDTVFLFATYQNTRKIRNVNIKWYIYRDNISSATHQNTDTGYFIRDIIPAWEWCRQQCNDISAKNQCDIRLFAVVSEYLRKGCSSGTPLNKLQQALELPAVQASLLNYDILWNGSKKEYEAFLSHPYRYWISHRTIGILQNFSKALVRTPLLRTIYLNQKHKEDITPFV